MSLAVKILIMLAIWGSGFGSGYYTKARFDQANKTDQVVAARRTDAKSLAESTVAENGLQKDLKRNGAQGQRERAAIRGTLKVPAQMACPPEKRNATTPDSLAQEDVDIGAFPLSPAAVRVLNDARRGIAPDPAAFSDAERRGTAAAR